MTLVLGGAVLLLCLLPSLLFLGLWHGLCRMQRRSLVTRTRTRAGYTDPAVTWGDVVDAYADPEKNLFTTSSASDSGSSESRSTTIRDDQCAVCAAENDPLASYCHNCLGKLE